MDENFSERFKKPLADIQRLSRLVQRATSTGSGAELRVTRLAVERIDEDIRVGLEGMARESAELRQGQAQLRVEQEKMTAALERFNDKGMIPALVQEVWRQAGISGTALLVGQRNNLIDDRSPKDTGVHSGLRITAAGRDGQESCWDNKDEGNQLAIVDVSRSIERLLGSVSRGVRVIDVGQPPALALDQRIARALERWTIDSATTLLYLEAAAYCAEARLPQTTVAAARIIETADKLDLPTISFFCDHLTTGDEAGIVSPPLLGLVYSLIFQLTQLLPPLTNIGSLIDVSQINSLEASYTSWPLALQILSKLLHVGPSFLLCIIDGFHAFETPDMDSTLTRELLGVFQKTMEVEQKVFKVLFTDSKRAFSLVQAIPWEKREIVEGTRKAGSGGGKAPAGRMFVNLRMDAA